MHDFLGIFHRKVSIHAVYIVNQDDKCVFYLLGGGGGGGGWGTSLLITTLEKTVRFTKTLHFV